MIPPWQYLTTGGASLAALILFALAVRAILGRRRRRARPPVDQVAADTSQPAQHRGRDAVLNIAAWLVAAVAGFLAAQGQIDFAEWAGVDDWRRYLVPAILEPAVVVLLLLANRRSQRLADKLPARSPRPLLALALVMGGFAVYTNAMHAGRGGLVFGAASAIALILWWVKLRDAANPGAVEFDDANNAASRKSRRTARYRWLRWVFFPRQTHKAWRISLGYSVTDPERGLDLARLWRRELDAARERAGDPFPLRAAWWRARRTADEAVRVELDRPAGPPPATAPPAPVMPPRVKVAPPRPVAPEPGEWWRDLVDQNATRAEQMREILYHAVRLGRTVPRAFELDQMVTPPARDYAKQNYRTWVADARERVARESQQRNGRDLTAGGVR